MVLLSLSYCFNLFIHVAPSTNIHGASARPNADTSRTTPPPESTTVLHVPWPKPHGNSKTSKPKQFSNVRFTSSRRSNGSTNDRTRATVLYSPRAKPTVYSTTCKCELIKCHFQPELRFSMERNLLWSNFDCNVCDRLLAFLIGMFMRRFRTLPYLIHPLSIGVFFSGDK